MRRIFASLLIVAAILCSSCQRSVDPLTGFPHLVLWAWERPENLSFIIPSATGVAYLAETITIKDASLRYRPRMQPLCVPPATPLIAVVRIETANADRPAAKNVALEIARVATRGSTRTPIRALQIDFDARASEHAYYREVLTQLRQSCPRNIALEMTSLVSWCEGDDWIRGLPVVEAVPMFFRMGIDPHTTNEPLRDPLCTSSIGISTEEFYVSVPHGRRVFVFTRGHWTETKYRAILQASREWF